MIEPFTGSGAVFLNTNYDQYLLAENNPDLIMLFKFLQKEGLEFIDYCQHFFANENNDQIKYYYFREQFNSLGYNKDNRYKAALFLYLNRHGYNGLCRYNKQGFYNVPFGRYHKPYFPRQEMFTFYEKSQRAEFLLRDFRKTFSYAQKGDIIYCDPPYVRLSPSANFTSYTNRTFKEREQIELTKLAIESATKGITVIISNHDTAFTRHHYRQGKIFSFPVKRLISCKPLTRRVVQELVVVFNHSSYG